MLCQRCRGSKARLLQRRCFKRAGVSSPENQRIVERAIELRRTFAAATVLFLEAQHHRPILHDAARIFVAGRHADDVNTGLVDDMRAAAHGRKVVKGAGVSVLPIKSLAVIVATRFFENSAL